jgi:ribonuclease D
MAVHAQDIADRIRQATSQPVLPKKTALLQTPQELELVAQFIAVLLGMRCRQQSIATMLVGRSQDIKDLIVGQHVDTGDVPTLLQGWRAELVGNDLQRLLQGQLTLRVADPHAAVPIVMEPYR